MFEQSTVCPKKVPLKILDTQFRTIASMSRSGEHINLFNVAIVRNRQHVNHLLTFKVKGLTLFHQTGMVRALSLFCMVDVVVAGGFGTRKLGVGKIVVAYIPGLS